MNQAENIKKMYEKAKLDTQVGRDKAVLEKMKEIYIQESKAKPKQAKLSIWRIIMKSKITKCTAAAVIIIVVVSVSFLYMGTQQDVYGVDQTIAAMRKVSTVHCFINLFLGVRMEIWIKVNPETGENEYYHMAMPGMEIISSPDETYRYNKLLNVVTHLKGKGHVVSDIRFGRFIEDMVEVAKNINGKVQFKPVDINGEKPVILLVIETDDTTIESIVNPETKLPISIHFKGEPRPGQYGQSIEDITYNEPIPEGIFDFEIPEGAQVIEK